MKAHIVIGKNFGDEGKGLATDYFAQSANKNNASCIAVRFNGGAQAGHTVDTVSGRFVFHELSAGSFRKVPTYWGEDFLPDLYKLEDELEEFRLLTGFVPRIIASPLCRVVNIDDVLINMAAETFRGSNRHGSCGMGIYEAVLRSEKYPLYLKDVKAMSAEELFARMKKIRAEYCFARLEELGINVQKYINDLKENNSDNTIREKTFETADIEDGLSGNENLKEYLECLFDDNVLKNAAAEIIKAAELVELADESILASYDEVVFEGAQGLLLDTDNTEFAPHISASHTGIKNAFKICQKAGIKDIEVLYVTRSYVTRHGAGVLPKEEEWAKYNLNINDATNIENPWQGTIRYAPHESVGRFTEYVIKDLKSIEGKEKNAGDAENDLQSEDSGRASFREIAAAKDVKIIRSLFITHLNETDNKLLFADDTIGEVSEFLKIPEIKSTFDRVYLSNSPFSENSILIQ